MSSSLRTQSYTFANAPRVLIYDNYIMYDRFMLYKRFNRDNCQCDFNEPEDEIVYYRNNYRNFLVLKFSRTTNEIILFDSVRQYLYTIGNPYHTHEVEVVNSWNEHHKRDMYHIRIQSVHVDSYCLNLKDEYFCFNKQDMNINNGYCKDCQHNNAEFDDIDIDRLLTFNEFVSLPEFADYPDIPLFDELDKEVYKQQHNNEEKKEKSPSDGYSFFHTYDSDTDDSE